MTEIPRIAEVATEAPSTLHIRWRDRPEAVAVAVDVAGWIERGGPLLAPLRDPATFTKAAIGAYGAAVTWDDDEGDLAIDAAHLELLADAQRPFGPGDAEQWQRDVGLSNQEAAEVLGVGLATWKRFKAGDAVPAPVVRLCRAAQRDPIIVEAYRRRHLPGRPRTAESRKQG